MDWGASGAGACAVSSLNCSAWQAQQTQAEHRYLPLTIYWDTPPPPLVIVRSDRHCRSSWVEWCFLEMEGGSLVAQRGSNGVKYLLFRAEREYRIWKSRFRLPDREWKFRKLHLLRGHWQVRLCNGGPILSASLGGILVAYDIGRRRISGRGPHIVSEFGWDSGGVQYR
jgi:hypothetical protein